MSKELNFTETLKLLNIHLKYCQQLEDFYKETKYSKFRMPNFPETISENLIRHIIQIKEKYSCVRNVYSGDLCKENGKRIECKTFTSFGPCSFGPLHTT